MLPQLRGQSYSDGREHPQRTFYFPTSFGPANLLSRQSATNRPEQTSMRRLRRSGALAKLERPRPDVFHQQTPAAPRLTRGSR